MRCKDGAIKFEGDWPGTFLRGDTSFGYALSLRALLRATEGLREPFGIRMHRLVLEGLLGELESSNIAGASDLPETITLLKPFKDCLREHSDEHSTADTGTDTDRET